AVTAPGVSLHVDATASTGELGLAAYVHVWLIQRWAKDWRTVVSSVGRIVARLAIVDSKPALTKIFMHFSTTSTALFGRIRLLDCAGPGDGRRRRSRSDTPHGRSQNSYGFLTRKLLESVILIIAASAGDDPRALEAPLGRLRTTCQLHCAAFGHRAPFPYR